jgi:hypothetical protein
LKGLAGDKEGSKGGGELEMRRTGRDTFYAATASKATDGRFGDALDVVAEDFAMTFCSAFPKTLPSFSTCCWMLAYVEKGKYGRKCNNVADRYELKYSRDGIYEFMVLYARYWGNGGLMLGLREPGALVGYNDILQGTKHQKGNKGNLRPVMTKC